MGAELFDGRFRFVEVDVARMVVVVLVENCLELVKRDSILGLWHCE